MAEQRQGFRFRLPWLSAVTSARPATEPQPQPPRPVARPTAEIQAPAQPATSMPVHRAPFRPAGIAPTQSRPQSRSLNEPKVASLPSSPPHTTQARAASVPPTPSPRATETLATVSQPASPSRAPAQTRVAVSPVKPPTRAATQSRAGSLAPSPTHVVVSQTQPKTKASPEPQSPSPSRAGTQRAATVASSPSLPFNYCDISHLNPLLNLDSVDSPVIHNSRLIGIFDSSNFSDMDFLKNALEKKNNNGGNYANKPTKPHKPSPSDVMSSAKTVAEAAKASLGKESDKVDKAKVADAAGTLLGAASHYGKMEQKSYGKYVGKAETYLHKYGQKGSSTTTTTTTAASTTYSQHSGSGSTAGTHAPPYSGGGGQGNSGNKYGEYFKMAEGFLKKH